MEHYGIRVEIDGQRQVADFLEGRSDTLDIPSEDGKHWFRLKVRRNGVQVISVSIRKGLPPSPRVDLDPASRAWLAARRE